MLIYMCILLCQQSFVTNHLNNKKGGCLESRIVELDFLIFFRVL